MVYRVLGRATMMYRVRNNELGVGLLYKECAHY